MAKDPDETGGYRAQTLTRGLAVLRTMADARRPVTLQDLYGLTGIPKPTLVRLLAILTQEGCTVRLDDRPTYGLGPTVTAIAAGVTEDLRPEALARPFLERLSGILGHTANLGVLASGQVLHLCVVLADRPIRYEVRGGARDDPYSTGLGKALLGFLEKADVDKVLGGRPLVAKTPRTITSRTKLDTELRRVRKQGYAYDAEEGALGLCCFAVPITVDGRVVAAVSVSGPAGELPIDRGDVIVPELQKIADEIATEPRLSRTLATITPEPITA